MAIVTDNVPGNSPDTVTWEISVIETSLTLNLKVYLEGAYNGSIMQGDLNGLGLLPLAQPYSVPPWNYFGSEEVLSIPGTNIIDWLLIELRDAPSAAQAIPATTVYRSAVFVKSDGSIQNIDGSTELTFPVSITDSLYVVIRHRDHLDIMSSIALTESGGSYSYDFTTGSGKVYGGESGYKEIATGVWGMVAGDINADGIIDINDKSAGWKLQGGFSGFQTADLNLDGQVNNPDKNTYWLPNIGKGSSVPQ